MSGYIEVENDETGEIVEVEYYVSGRYSRATLYSPAEYPEVEFIDPPPWVDEGRLADQVLRQERDYAAECRAEYLMDDW